VSARDAIACLGAGRMARGIAVAFAYAGHRVTIVDLKQRDDVAYARAAAAASGEVRATLATLAGLGLFAPSAVDGIAARVVVLGQARAAAALATSSVIFECLPEVLDLKREGLARAAALADPQ
jgi:3-hydroxybutyryl-CoA dehydrogenase